MTAVAPGAYVAVYRMEFEGWANDRAVAEVRARGYDTLDEDVDLRTYLEGYRPRGKKAEPR